MGTKTGIAWATHTASPWHGCAHASLEDGTPHVGCISCYAEKMAKRNPGTLGVWGENGTRVKSKSFISNLRVWNRRAEKAGKIETVFPSICDPFEDRPELVPWRREMFEVIDECPWLMLLLLTKRPQNVRAMWPWVWCGPDFPGDTRESERQTVCAYRPNVSILYSASDQKSFDSGAIATVECSDLCAGTGFSLEPLKGRIDLSGVLPIERDRNGAWRRKSKFHEEAVPGWGIIGVESDGPRVGDLGEFATEAEWWDGAHDIVDQLVAVDVATFFKQGPVRGRVSHDPESWPEWARRQEFPASPAGM